MLCQQCEKNEGVEPHTCPFEDEIGEQDHLIFTERGLLVVEGGGLCNCCDDCQETCADNI